MNNVLPVAPALWRQRYEALRQYALERRQVLGAEPLGLVVLLARGLAGWMQSWWEASAEPPRASAPLPGNPAPPQWQEQLTSLLAHMTAQLL